MYTHHMHVHPHTHTHTHTYTHLLNSTAYNTHTKYRIVGKFDEELILVVWRIQVRVVKLKTHQSFSTCACVSVPVHYVRA